MTPNQKIFPPHGVYFLGKVPNAQCCSSKIKCVRAKNQRGGLLKPPPPPDGIGLKTLIQSTVTVRLDYCNSLYYGLSLKSIKKLQLAQKAAARLIAKILMRDPITNVLCELHWLPVTKRCQYKLLVLTYKTLHGTTPT